MLAFYKRRKKNICAFKFVWKVNLRYFTEQLIPNLLFSHTLQSTFPALLTVYIKSFVESPSTNHLPLTEMIP